MTNKYSLSDVSKLSKEFRKYSENSENVGEHIFELGKRRELLNQLCTQEMDKFTLEIIEAMYLTTKNQFIESKTKIDFSRQENSNMRENIAQLHDDMLELETRLGGVKDD